MTIIVDDVFNVFVQSGLLTYCALRLILEFKKYRSMRRMEKSDNQRAHQV